MSSDMPIRYSIVVPFYNEQENIPTLYMKITEVMDSIGEPYEMVFVDDGSKDNSYRVLSEIYEHDRRVNVVRLRRNFGQTPALKAGFDFARGEIVISMDGDLQHDPDEIPRLVDEVLGGGDPEARDSVELGDLPPVRYRHLIAHPKHKAKPPEAPGQRGHPPSIERPRAARPWRTVHLG